MTEENATSAVKEEPSELVETTTVAAGETAPESKGVDTNKEETLHTEEAVTPKDFKVDGLVRHKLVTRKRTRLRLCLRKLKKNPLQSNHTTFWQIAQSIGFQKIKVPTGI